MSNTVIAEGLEFPEGPAFDRNGHLFVVEIRGGQVSRIDTDGKLSVFAKTGGGPNGANFAADGDLYVCNNGGFPGPNKEHGRLERIDSQGNVTVILTQIDGIELASPNDLGFDAAGNLYFTDPIWGDGQPGHVCFLSTEGEARRLHTGLAFPNGIAVTPDGEHLIVCETVTHKLHIYDILAPGRVSAPREFADLGEGAGPDGGLVGGGRGTVYTAVGPASARGARKHPHRRGDPVGKGRPVLRSVPVDGPARGLVRLRSPSLDADPLLPHGVRGTGIQGPGRLPGAQQLAAGAGV